MVRESYAALREGEALYHEDGALHCVYTLLFGDAASLASSAVAPPLFAAEALPSSRCEAADMRAPRPCRAAAATPRAAAMSPLTPLPPLFASCRRRCRRRCRCCRRCRHAQLPPPRAAVRRYAAAPRCRRRRRRRSRRATDI